MERIAAGTSLIITVCFAFFLFDLLPVIVPAYSPPFILVGLLEACITLQLIGAWIKAEKQYRLGIIYLFIALLALRLAFRASIMIPGMWGLRASQVHSVFWGFLEYGIGSLLLHPFAYYFCRQQSQRMNAWTPAYKRWGLFLGFLILGLFFCLFLSKNISRDGYDWILRTSKPVWFHYVREPLTIGFYRALFLGGRSLFAWTPYQAIASLSVFAGLWVFYWFHRRLREQTTDAFSLILGWLLIFSSGGLLALFCGHIEVYPVLLAGLTTTLYWAYRYLEGKTGIIPVAVGFSITFLLHLSTGWLIPAFLCLPFLKNGSVETTPSRIIHCFKELALSAGVFLFIQSLFWSGLILGFYEGKIANLSAIIHENFFVGPDQAMFLPLGVMGHPLHLWDLLNEYLYLSISGWLLIPLSLIEFFKNRDRKTLFWLLLVGGYSLYSLTWNPDRGFPEDWDLFSALPLLVVFFQLHLFPGGRKITSQNVFSTSNPYPIWLYLAVLGTLPFAWEQIWYHHITPFMMGR